MTNPKNSSARTYVFYEGHSGEPKSQWQNRGKATVPGCTVGRSGVFPPFFRWISRGRTAKEAAYFIHNSVTSTSREDGLGIWWDRDAQPEVPQPAPLGNDLEQHWALIAWCKATTITLWPSKEEAETEAARLKCTGGCCGDHEVTLMTIDEVRKLSPVWWDGLEDLDPF